MKRKSAKKAPVIEPDRSLRCHTCGRAIAGFESVHYGSIERDYRDLCNRCFNEEVATTGEIDFSHVQFEPLEISDAAGTPHRFHFEVRLLGDQVALEAFELVDGGPGGYQFQVLGDAEEDLFELMGRMVGPHPFRWTVSNLSFRPLIPIYRIPQRSLPPRAAEAPMVFFFASLPPQRPSVMAQEP